MSTFPIIPRPRPRLQRPQLGIVPKTGPRVAMRPAGGHYSDRTRARARLVALYASLMVVSLLAYATRPQTAEAEPMTAPIVRVVGEHVFEEAPPEASTLLSSPGEERMAKISHYTPWAGGPNCATFVGGKCISNMASGLPWDVWVGRAAACPVELPFWSTVTLPGGEVFVCLDRGGKIVTTSAGELWIDLLVASPPVPYGTVMPVVVRRPYWMEGGGQ